MSTAGQVHSTRTHTHVFVQQRRQQRRQHRPGTGVARLPSARPEEAPVACRFVAYHCRGENENGHRGADPAEAGLEDQAACLVETRPA